VPITAVERQLDERGQIADRGDAVVASAGMDHQLFSRADVEARTGRIHAVEAHTFAIGSHGEFLASLSADDLNRVDVGATFDDIAAVARVPDHSIVAGATEHLIVAGAAGQPIVAITTEQEISAAPPDQGVIAALAE
jgi:hypothetical protein